jgi:hypothetical protein
MIYLTHMSVLSSYVSRNTAYVWIGYVCTWERAFLPQIIRQELDALRLNKSRKTVEEKEVLDMMFPLRWR